IQMVGIVSVRSAYRLAVKRRDLDKGGPSTSSNSDGARPTWKKFWKIRAPPKVMSFAWKLIHHGLPTRLDKKYRKIEELGTCEICGVEDEDDYHAVMRCDHAVALRSAMRRIWALPAEDHLTNSDPEWLLNVINRYDADMCAQLLMVFWRAWYVRNEISHVNLMKMFGWLHERMQVTLPSCGVRHKQVASNKGKQIVGTTTISQPRRRPMEKWEHPDEGWVKINVDGAYTEQSGEAGVGIIIRDHVGKALLSSWRVLFNMMSAEDVEACACREGLSLASEWIPRPTVLESDCSVVVSYL
ncbi:hypothetical protein EJB05_33427, partial [Eragrostis curvula]